MSKNKKTGFTLIELVIVLVILGILAIIAVPNYLDLRTTARENALKSTLGTIRASIHLQHSKNLLTGTDSFPTSITANMFEENEVPMDPINNTREVVITTQNPVSGSATGVVGGWLYNTGTGEVRCNHTQYDGF